MNKELSEEVFQSRLSYIQEGILAYVDIKPDSVIDVILLHQHLGLQNYVRVMGQVIVNSNISIIFPNLFGQAQENQSQDLQNEDYLRSLNHQKIAQTTLSIINFVSKRGNQVVLMGFSLGASIGLKILEYTNKVNQAFFFYGIPPLASIRPQFITADVTVFMGVQDEIKHLSDKTVSKKAKQIYQQNQNVKVMVMEKGKHGFMNPACEEYSEDLFNSCSAIVQNKLQKLQSQQSKIQKNYVAFDGVSVSVSSQEEANIASNIKTGKNNQALPSSGRRPQTQVEKKKQTEKDQGGCSVY